MFNFRVFNRVHVLVLALAVVLASCGTPSTSPTETSIPPQPTATEAPPDLESELDEILESYVNMEAFGGSVMIARDEKVLFSKGYGFADREEEIPNTPQTKFRLASITKQFTAAAILLLQAEGELDAQDLICDYLPDCPPAWEAITIHHLLTHTSGIPNFTEFPDYTSSIATPSPPRETMNRFVDMPLDFRPGEDWSYSNSGYILLGLIIEQAAGQPYEAFLQESIFTPHKMANTGYDHNLDDIAVGYAGMSEAVFIDMSTPYAAGGLYSTVEDLYLWDQSLFAGRVLSQDLLSEMFTEHVPIPGFDGLAYGYGWFIGEENGHRVIEHGGGIDGFATSNAHYPDEKVTLILLSNLENSEVDLIRSALIKQVLGEE